ncbi:hypothetical protein [Nostoc sp.]|uniref:hypothetical protein n=1 Tax=Nostoc sp. TaxID=1180 RepID=UPI002FEF5F1D
MSKLIRRALIASGLFVGALASFSPAVIAADLGVSADNTAVTSVTVNATGNGFSIFDYTAGVSATKIGQAEVSSNDVDGFIVSAKSANTTPGLLRTGGSGASDTIAYSLKIGSSSAVAMTGTVQPVLTQAFESACADTSGCSKDVEIVIAQSAIEAKKSGTYEDTIEVTIAGQ